MDTVQPSAPAPVPAISGGEGAGDAVGPRPLVRAYRLWQGNNEFLLRGRLIFGPDIKSIFMTILLIIGPVAVFCAYVARKLLDHFPHHWGYSIVIIVIVLTIFVLITLLLTSGRDPGIVPRNYRPLEQESNELTPRSILSGTRDVIINGVSVTIKYCDTCMLYRPPRCSHCAVCDNCVERFDHHCPWIGQCIGLRNYRFYYMFVSSATLLCLYVHAFCWVHVTRIMDSEHKSIWKALIKTPASVALIVYSFISAWFVGGLTVFHTYLISTNQSTYENFRNRYVQNVNPYNKGVVENFKEVFCSVIPPSKNNFRSKVPIPKDPTGSSSRRRAVDFDSPVMRKTPGDLELGRPWSGNNDVDDDDESYFEDGVINSKEFNKGSGLTDMYVGLSRILHTEGRERQIGSTLRNSLRERSSRKWDINPALEDEIQITGESNRINGDLIEPNGNSQNGSIMSNNFKDAELKGDKS